MLTALHIENFALIDQLDLQLGSGLNVLTGETGAGKSIILDAIDAVLGGKASQRWIRSGARKAVIEAHFVLTSPVAQWLQAHGLEPRTEKAETVCCSRELSAGKSNLRSRFRLNGQTVTKPQMESLRQLLVEITAQGQTLQVSSADRQRDWLDGFGGEVLVEQRQQVAQRYAEARQAQQQLERRRRLEAERLQQLDLFEYQYRELSQANLEDSQELELLLQEQQRLSHTVELQQQSYQVYQILYENEAGTACADLLGKVETLLSDMLRYDPDVEPMLDMVNDALAQVEEAGRQINSYGETLEADPQRLDVVDQRVRQLKTLSRKYEGRSVAELIAYRDELQQSVEAMNGDGQSLEELEAVFQAAQQQLEAACQQLRSLRQQAASALEQRLVAELRPLAMERVQFQAALHPIEPAAHGADRVEFLFSPNPGEPLQSLAATASGGEMSRFLLALKASISQSDQAGTLIFDEIDVGVSGRVAQAIAEKLSHLGQRHQVLCVTHQPMVAAMADTHFRVGKQVIETAKRGRKANVAVADGDAVRTVVRIVPLQPEQRREELAQLAGGHSHQEALSFADALLTQAKTLRQSL